MTHYDIIESNKRKKTILLIIFYFVVAFSTFVIFWALNIANTASSIILSLFISFIYTIIINNISYKLILSSTHAREAKRDEYFDYYTVAENLSIYTRIPKPKLYVIEDPVPNAFTTGRGEKAYICATTGLLKSLDRAELEGVIAHEMAHIVHKDVDTNTIIAGMVFFLSMMIDFANRMGRVNGLTNTRSKKNNKDQEALYLIKMILFLIVIIFAPLVVQFLKFAISRQMEYLADARAVEFTRNPKGLAKALMKLEAYHQTNSNIYHNPSIAPLYIVSPFAISGGIKRMLKIGQTHPPIKERIAILLKLAGQNPN